MYCNFCGEKTEEEAKYCSSCGNALPFVSGVNAEIHTPERDGVFKPKKEKKKKSKWKKWLIIGIICFVLLLGAIIAITALFFGFQAFRAIRPYLWLLEIIRDIFGL